MVNIMVNIWLIQWFIMGIYGYHMVNNGNNGTYNNYMTMDDYGSFHHSLIPNRLAPVNSYSLFETCFSSQILAKFIEFVARTSSGLSICSASTWLFGGIPHFQTYFSSMLENNTHTHIHLL